MFPIKWHWIRYRNYEHLYVPICNINMCEYRMWVCVIVLQFAFREWICVTMQILGMHHLSWGGRKRWERMGDAAVSGGI